MLWRCGIGIKDSPPDCCECVRLIYDAKRSHRSLPNPGEKGRGVSAHLLFHQAKKYDRKSSQCCDRVQICRGLYIPREKNVEFSNEFFAFALTVFIAFVDIAITKAENNNNNNHDDDDNNSNNNNDNGNDDCNDKQIAV